MNPENQLVFWEENIIISIMQSITFITGNQKKADNLARLIGMSVEHIKLDLDEIQSLDLREVVEHKARQAYAKVQKPIIVEDVALEFEALGRLPGTFIKFFIEEMSLEDICRLLDGRSRRATGRCGYGYCDADGFVYFESSLGWQIAEHPGGDNWFWWDPIFIPDGYDTVRSLLSPDNYDTVYLQIKPIRQVREFLLTK